MRRTAMSINAKAMKLHAELLPVMAINLNAMIAAVSWMMIERARTEMMVKCSFVMLNAAPFPLKLR